MILAGLSPRKQPSPHRCWHAAHVGRPQLVGRAPNRMLAKSGSADRGRTSTAPSGKGGSGGPGPLRFPRRRDAGVSADHGGGDHDRGTCPSLCAPGASGRGVVHGARRRKPAVSDRNSSRGCRPALVSGAGSGEQPPRPDPGRDHRELPRRRSVALADASDQGRTVWRQGADRRIRFAVSSHSQLAVGARIAGGVLVIWGCSVPSTAPLWSPEVAESGGWGRRLGGLGRRSRCGPGWWPGGVAREAAEVGDGGYVGGQEVL